MTPRYIDLTFPIHEGMQTFPVHWHPVVEITQLGRFGIEDRETRKVCMGTHTGTHCDAPRHFIPNGRTIDEIPLDTLVGPATLVDFSAAAPGQCLEPPDFVREIGHARPDRLILRFDWSKNWGTRRYYQDHPFLSQDSARFLVDRGVKLLAMDTPMPDNPAHGSGCSIDSPNHKILLGSDVVLVEYLCNLVEIQKNEVELVVLPLKIRGADGSPARCIAIER